MCRPDIVYYCRTAYTYFCSCVWEISCCSVKIKHLSSRRLWIILWWRLIPWEEHFEDDCGHRTALHDVSVLLGEAPSWLPELVERAKALRVNAGTTPAAPPFSPRLLSGGGPLWFRGHPCRPNLTSRSTLSDVIWLRSQLGVLACLSQSCYKSVVRT